MSPQEITKEVLELAERSIATFLANEMVIQLRQANDPSYLSEVAVDFLFQIEELERVLLLIQDWSTTANGRAKALPMPSGSCF